MLVLVLSHVGTYCLVSTLAVPAHASILSRIAALFGAIRL
jgi:hypothetical protein|eukprot:COSAG06_NODE_677_length_13149_cov_37.657854_3_plen_40_part_00